MPNYCCKQSPNKRHQCGFLIDHEGRCDWEPPPPALRKAYKGRKNQISKAKVILGYIRSLDAAMRIEETGSQYEHNLLSLMKMNTTELVEEMEKRGA